jgi:hypothetical protein
MLAKFITPLDFRVEVEEGVEARLKLLLDLLPASFEHVHGDVSFTAIVQLQRGISNFGEFVRREKPHSIDQGEICHGFILRRMCRAYAKARFILMAKGQMNTQYAPATISAVIPKKIGFAMFAISCACLGQEASQKPQVKVNVLNVCTPSPDEQKEIASALSGIPRKPTFSADFEVDRGRSVLDQGSNLLAAAGAGAMPTDASTADFVRIRRDVSGGSYSNAQYSFSRDSHQMVETLVFRVRDPKELLQISIEDSASSVTSPGVMLGASTPTSRIKLERFGKSSVVLARCNGQGEGPPPDQKAYEPLFASAASIMSDYRGILGARRLVPEELARIGGVSAAPVSKSASQTRKP